MYFYKVKIFNLKNKGFIYLLILRNGVTSYTTISPLIKNKLLQLQSIW